MREVLPDDRILRALHATPRVVLGGELREVRAMPTLHGVEGITLCAGEVVGGCSLYVVSMEAPDALTSAPPAVEWALCARFGRFAEQIASGTLNWSGDGWSSRGSVVHVRGLLCEGLELWARSKGAAPVRLVCRWVVVVADGAQGLPAVASGELV